MSARHPTLYTDGAQLAVESESIQLVPPTKREPGNATHWREALDSWFVDSIGIIDAMADLAQTTTKTMRQSARGHLAEQP